MQLSLQNKKILLGITGSIAAYKSAELARLLIDAGAIVKVVMTESACQFITPLTFQAITANKVYTKMFDPENDSAMLHISLAKWADIILIAPASGSILGKLAHGIADDLLSSTCLATDKPIILAPAMNRQMWENLALQKNVKLLNQYGYQFLGPISGSQACGDEGLGRMMEPEDIFKELINLATFPEKYHDLKVLITAGPTQEPIDPIRYISNYSSGKMGYALAAAFQQAGAQVTLISGPSALEPPARMKKFISVKMAEEMHQAVLDHISTSNIFIASAAVSDYKPRSYSPQKIKKQNHATEFSLIPTTDILKSIATLNTNCFLVGFAAETDDVLSNAQDKLLKKNLHMIVANKIYSDGQPFQSDENAVSILQKNKSPIHIEKSSKQKIATQLVDIILSESRKSTFSV